MPDKKCRVSFAVSSLTGSKTSSQFTRVVVCNSPDEVPYASIVSDLSFLFRDINPLITITHCYV